MAGFVRRGMFDKITYRRLGDEKPSVRLVHRPDLKTALAEEEEQAAAAFKQGGTAVGVRGYTDTVGNPEFNLQLSLQRAAAVKDALQRNGVPSAAILSGVGEQNLPVQTADQVPERLNRSVDIAISRRALRSIMSDKDYCAALAKKWREYTRTDASTGAPQAIASVGSAKWIGRSL